LQLGLKDIAKFLKRERCERLIRYTGQEIAFTGLGAEIPNAKVNLGTFSNKVKVLVEVPNIAQALDNNQYLLCKQASDPICPEELRTYCLKVRLIQIQAFSQLHALLSIPKPDKKLNIEIRKWVKYSNKLIEISINALAKDLLCESEQLIKSSGANAEVSFKTSRKDLTTINSIMKYQSSDKKELEEAVLILKQPFETE
jgi:hypothetical protein